MFCGSNRSRSFEIESSLFLRVPEATDITDTLSDVRHGVLPIAFVLDGDVPVEFLPTQLAQDAFHVGDTETEWQIGRIGIAGLDNIFQMHADDAALEEFQSGN